MKITLFAIAWMTCQAMTAQNVSQSEALNLASRFIEQQSEKNIVLKPVDLSEKSFSHLYVFSDDVNHAFVIMSGNRKAFPVIAWSDVSNFGTDIPAPVEEYLIWAEKQLEESERNPLANQKVDAEWQSLDQWGRLPEYSKTTITPLLSTTWDQGCYYNALCPAAPTGPCGLCYAGCVATAMGQVMKYHNYPPSGEGSNIYGTALHSNIHADFSAATYVWDSMPDFIDEDNQWIAEFLFHCGVSVNMNYAPDGSGANTADSRDAFVENFKYADYAFHSDKGVIDDIYWIDMLANELLSRRPVMYRGFGSGGHAFVLDGMESNNRFHFNWGWSGYYNGYFYLTNLNPGGADFTSDQAAIFGVEPRVGDQIYCPQNQLFTAASDTIADGSGVDRYGNYSDCSWLIQPPGTGLIYIHFMDLAIETGVDMIHIYNGTSSNDPLVCTVSGFEVPDEILVWGPSAYVVFQSDGMFRADGFTFRYVSSPVGLDEAWNSEKISVFPVPAGDLMTIRFEDNAHMLVKSIDLISSNGAIVTTLNHPDESEEMDVSQISSGVYALRFVGENESIIRLIEIQ